MMKEVCMRYRITMAHSSYRMQLQENSEKWRYCWLFEVGSMRNTHLKTVRKLWKEYVTWSLHTREAEHTMDVALLGYSLDAAQSWRKRWEQHRRKSTVMEYTNLPRCAISIEQKSSIYTI